MSIDFLSVDDVLLLHADQILRYGGNPGVRDFGLLQSAVAQPSAAFGGSLFHQDRFEMTAAFLYHIVQNHPFIDGNKRAGAVAALLFLQINDTVIDAEQGELYEIAIGVAKGETTKAEVAEFFRERAS